VEWAVSDDVALESLGVEFLNGAQVVDVVEVALSGTSAEGSSFVRTRGNATSVRLSVRDAAGNVTVASNPFP